MSSIDLNTSTTGTYVVTYKALDTAGNETTKNRNVYITDNPGVPSLDLIGNNLGTQYVFLNASKTSAIYDDPGVTARDQYNNDVSYLVSKNITMFIQNSAGSNGSANGFTETAYNSTNLNRQLTTGNAAFLFENGNDGNLPNTESSSENVNEYRDYHTNQESGVIQASYFKITYTLAITNQDTKYAYRYVYITDIQSPVLSLSETTKSFSWNYPISDVISESQAVFSAVDEFWQIGGSSNTKGFSNLGYVWKNNVNQTISNPSSIDTSQSGTYKVYAVLNTSYISNTGTLNANYVNSGAGAQSGTKSYHSDILTVNIQADGVAPTVTFVSYNDVDISGIGNLNTVNGHLYWTIPSSGLYSFSDLNLWRKQGITSNAEINVNDNDLANIQESNVSVTYTKGSFSKDKSQRDHLGKKFSGADASVIGNPGSDAIWLGTYTVTDPAGNSTTVTRNIYIIDATTPTLTLDVNPNLDTNYLTYGTGLNIIQYDHTTAAGANTKRVEVTTQTTISDNYRDTSNNIVSPSLEFNPTSYVIRPAYPKNAPLRTFILQYNQVQDKLLVLDFYGDLFNTTASIPGQSGDIHFDLSHHSLRNISTTVFTGIKATLGATNYTPTDSSNSFSYDVDPGNYHSFLTVEFGNLPIGNNVFDVTFNGKTLNTQIVITGI